MSPVAVGPLILVGVDAQPARIEGPALLWVETFWRISAPVQADLLISPQGVPGRGDAWKRPHEPCDWAWPTSRWRPGVIYRDRYPLRPPPEVLHLAGLPALLSGLGYGRLAISVVVQDEARALGASGEVGAVDFEPSLQTRLLLGGLGLGVVVLMVTLVITVVLFTRRRRRRTP